MPRTYKSPITSRIFELVAACLREATKDVYARYSDEHNRAQAHRTIRDLTDRFALEFELSNPRFDRNRFYSACGSGE